MQKTVRYAEKCPICGTDRSCTRVIDDGIDFMGHHRGNGHSRTIDHGCYCAFAKAAKNLPSIKRMCHNCKYNKNGYCENEQNIKMVRESQECFAVSVNELKLTHLDKKCRHWEFDYVTLEDILKFE